jgi:hypothetical protein
MYTPNNALRHPRVARKLKIELRHERLVQAEVLEQIKKLRNALNISPSEGSLPLATRVPTNRHNDPFPRTQGERAVERSRAGTDKDGISVANKALGTMRPPALPDPAWSRPKTGGPSRPATPSEVSMLRSRVQRHKDAVETVLGAAAARSGGMLDGDIAQSSLESIGVKISPAQVLAPYASSRLLGAADTVHGPFHPKAVSPQAVPAALLATAGRAGVRQWLDWPRPPDPLYKMCYGGGRLYSTLAVQRRLRLRADCLALPNTSLPALAPPASPLAPPAS